MTAMMAMILMINHAYTNSSAPNTGDDVLVVIKKREEKRIKRGNRPSFVEKYTRNVLFVINISAIHVFSNNISSRNMVYCYA